MTNGRENRFGMVTLTDVQFGELKKMFQSYLRIAALGAIREMDDEHMERNVWLLKAAGFYQDEIAKILKSSQPVVSRILAGQGGKKKDKEGTEE